MPLLPPQINNGGLIPVNVVCDDVDAREGKSVIYFSNFTGIFQSHIRSDMS